MQLITLNIWGGHIHSPLLEFIKEHANVDIFCFQEVYHNATHKTSNEDRSVSLNIFTELHSLLPEHKSFFRPVIDNIYGVGAFVKNNITVRHEGAVSIHHNPEYIGRGPTHSRILQWLECCINNQIYYVINVHGLWNGMGKTDSLERIAQSKRIKAFMDTLNAPKILCGDFNLRPDTKSMQILEEGMINLIKTHNITSTRTSFYPKVEKFADYILISPEIKLNNFAVLKDEVSDHSALLLDFCI